MALQVNLQKMEETKSKLVLSLQKAGIVTVPVMELCFVLDVSGSYTDMHVPARGRPSVTEKLLERIVPWGMAFDPDKKVDVVTFSGGEENCVHVGAITPDNLGTFVEDYVVNCQGWNGGTDYSYPLTKCLEIFGFVQPAVAPVAQKSRGFLGGLFGKKEEPKADTTTPSVKRKSLVIFNTDGENYDKAQTERVLAESEKRGDLVYFIFLGVNRDQSKFKFIREMGDKFSNVAFVPVQDYASFVELSDEELTSMLVEEELLQWLSK